MAALGPTPEFSKSVARGYFFVPLIKGKASWVPAVDAGSHSRGRFPMPTGKCWWSGLQMKGLKGQGVREADAWGLCLCLSGGLSQVLEVDPR